MRVGYLSNLVSPKNKQARKHDQTNLIPPIVDWGATPCQHKQARRGFTASCVFSNSYCPNVDYLRLHLEQYFT